MSDYPDFFAFYAYDYQISQILVQNSTGGRVTYLAMREHNLQAVVIKQYQIARLSLTRLLKTQNCPDCFLSSANLNRTDLRGSNLQRAN
jgi:uncharacterized protein YjbI with pentapeptide repeats